MNWGLNPQPPQAIPTRRTMFVIVHVTKEMAYVFSRPLNSPNGKPLSRRVDGKLFQTEGCMERKNSLSR